MRRRKAMWRALRCLDTDGVRRGQPDRGAFSIEASHLCVTRVA
jgi:hypothetical protein